MRRMNEPMKNSVSGSRTLLSPDSILIAVLAVLGGIAIGVIVVQFDNPLLPAIAISGALIGLLVLRSPELGLLTLVFITYIRLSDILVQYHGAPSIAKLFVPFLAGVIVLHWWMYRDEIGNWRRAVITLGLYGVVVAASSFFATNQDLAWIGIDDFFRDGIISLIIVLLLTRGPTFRRVIWTLLAAGLFLATLTTLQQLTGQFTNNFFGFANAEVRNIVGELNDYRIQGPLSSNYYAMILVVLVPLALDRFWNERSLVLRGLALYGLIVYTLSIIFTFSRGGLLALLVVFVLMLFRHPPRPTVLLTTVLVIAMLLPLVPQPYVQRVVNLLDLLPTQSEANFVEEGALRGRLSEITVAALVFADHPITGVGYNNFELHYLDYSPELGLDPRREDRGAHNLYLEVAAETGILGLLTFLLLLGFMFQGLLKAYRIFTRHNREDYAHMTAAFAMGLIGFLTSSLFLHGAYPRYFWLLVGIALAIPNVAANEQKLEQPETQNPAH